ncbi:MAG TPA: hypothetical protein VJ739_15275 [Gemmataceae bacterium]|nr:hypothetical protein [Gemmataceae bacterium]
MIHFACPSCGKHLKAPDSGTGQKTSCPRCGQRLLIPAPVPVQNRTVLGQLRPGPVPPSVPRSASSPPATASDADSLVLLGLVKDSEVEGAGPAQPAHRPAGSCAATALAMLALAAGGAAMPVAVVNDQLLGVGLAGLGALLGVVGMFTAVLRCRGRGLGLSLAGAAVCGSVLFAAVMLPGKNASPDDRGTQAEPAKQGHGDAGGAAQEGPKEGPDGQASSKPGEVRPYAGNQRPPGSGKGTPLPRPGVIRLSGIHRRGDAADPFLLPGPSDLDLWMVNPVEADAKWKGKVVEVEMNLSDLRISTYEDNAALETPRNEFWGRRWELALFVFRGDKRKQLVGLQNLSGVVIIRGECEGLEGDFSYATFDHCEIVQRPVSATAPEPPEPKAVPPKFDPDDLDRTDRWAMMEASRIAKDADNSIRYRDAVEKFNEEARRYAGVKVRWSFAVNRIREDAVVLMWGHGSPLLELADENEGIRTSPRVGRYLELCVSDGAAGERRKKAAGTMPRVGEGISKEKAALLHPGDKITLTAEVVKVTDQGGSVKVVLRNLRAE